MTHPRSRIVLQANEITFNCDNNGEIILDRQASNTYLRISRFFEVVQSSRQPFYISPERGFSRLEKALKACGINFVPILET